MYESREKQLLKTLFTLPLLQQEWIVQITREKGYLRVLFGENFSPRNTIKEHLIGLLYQRTLAFHRAIAQEEHQKIVQRLTELSLKDEQDTREEINYQKAEQKRQLLEKALQAIRAKREEKKRQNALASQAIADTGKSLGCTSGYTPT